MAEFTTSVFEAGLFGLSFLISRVNCFLLSEMSSLSSSKRFFEKTTTSVSGEYETNSFT
jgi:hypothetical protein